MHIVVLNIVTSKILPFPPHVSEKRPAQTTETPLTFNSGSEMGIFVQDFHLLAPVELVPPVGHHLPQVVGVEAIVEGGPFQWWCVAGLLQAAVQVLQRGALLARLASCLCWPAAGLLAFVLLSGTP